MSKEGLVAILAEGTETGDYTRLALRRLDLWEVVENRTLQLADATAIVDQVVSGGAVCGVVYETAAHSAGDRIRIVGPMALPEGVELTYSLAAYSDRGAKLAHWLLESPVSGRATDAEGYSPAGPPAGDGE